MARNRYPARSMEQMRRWLKKNYPDLAVPGIIDTYIPGAGPRGVAANSDHDARLINLFSPRLIGDLSMLGAGRPYTGSEKYGIQTGLHELAHQVGPRYGDTRRDRFWEEGLAEAVSADLAPGYARSLPYSPRPAARFEDGSWSTPNDDFNFAPDAYAPNVAAVRGLSFNQALRQMAAGWEGLEDPGASPEAQEFRRRMLNQTAKGRLRTVAKVQRQMRREREAPGYLPQTVRSVGRAATAAAAIPRDPVAVSAQRVGRAVRAVARGVPTDVRRRVNAHRGGF